MKNIIKNIIQLITGAVAFLILTVGTYYLAELVHIIFGSDGDFSKIPVLIAWLMGLFVEIFILIILFFLHQLGGKLLEMLFE